MERAKRKTKLQLYRAFQNKKMPVMQHQCRVLRI